MNSINHKDLIILQKLRNNARTTLTKISKETGIPVTTIFDRLKSLEKELISKYTSLLNFERLGYTRTKLCIKVEKRNKDKLSEYLKIHPSVNSMFRIKKFSPLLI